MRFSTDFSGVHDGRSDASSFFQVLQTSDAASWCCVLRGGQQCTCAESMAGGRVTQFVSARHFWRGSTVLEPNKEAARVIFAAEMGDVQECLGLMQTGPMYCVQGDEERKEIVVGILTGCKVSAASLCALQGSTASCPACCTPRIPTTVVLRAQIPTCPASWF